MTFILSVNMLLHGLFFFKSVDAAWVWVPPCQFFCSSLSVITDSKVLRHDMPVQLNVTHLPADLGVPIIALPYNTHAIQYVNLLTL